MNGDNPLLGILLSLTAAGTWALAVILVRPASSMVGLHLGTLTSLVASFIFVAPIVFEADRQALFSLSWVALFWFAIIGLLAFSLGRFFYYTGIEKLGVSRATAIIAATPLVSVTLAIAFLDESLTFMRGLGILLVVAGVLLVVRGR